VTTTNTHGAAAKQRIAPSTEARVDFKREPYVVHRFDLGKASVDRVRAASWSFGFGAFSEVVYHDNYSRRKAGGGIESWPDTILRVVNGVFSIRRDWHIKSRLRWDEKMWQEKAEEMALAFLQLRCGPPGRGYFAMGTDFVYERGAFALLNCCATKLHAATLDRDLGWAADALMCGGGVGFECVPDPSLKLSAPEGSTRLYVVPDTREGWVESIEILVRSYMGHEGPVDFDYSELRKAGEPIKTFGGTSAGPEPLRKLHERLRMTFERFCRGEISVTRLKADLANQIGCCVVSGNVRRSAEILLGSAKDPEFLDLKDYSKYPEREEWGWMSNNSPRLAETEDFELIPSIAERIQVRGEPGFLNLRASQRFGRFGRESHDPADLWNPCAEIPLCDKEVCNLSEVYPSRCSGRAEIIRSAELACLYSSTVALLPTHRPETNAIVAKHRRIGVGMSGIADWTSKTSTAEATRTLRLSYLAVVEKNKKLARDAGVPASIRTTTMKPSGSVSLLAGVSPGGHYALGEFYIRRKRVSMNSPLRPLLDAAGYPCEKDVASDNTLVYEFPQAQAGVRTQAQAGVFEQALQLVMLQREWADNSVSFTLEFDPVTEGPRLGNLLAQIAPMVKSVSAFPRKNDYDQPPYEEITQREYKLRLRMVSEIDWAGYRSEGTGEADKYCAGKTCELPPRGKHDAETQAVLDEAEGALARVTRMAKSEAPS